MITADEYSAMVANVHKNSGKTVNKPAGNVVSAKEYKAIKSTPKGLLFIENTLNNNGFELFHHTGENKQFYFKEYKFLPDRKFRADVYFEVHDVKVIIEYHGLQLQGAKSRHTSIEGFSLDCTKANLAQFAGILYLTYTALTYKDFQHDLQKLL
jgi:hypothetical protein